MSDRIFTILVVGGTVVFLIIMHFIGGFDLVSTWQEAETFP